MSESICDDCKHELKESNEKPCNTCIQWVEGYLETVNYQAKMAKD